MQFLADVGAAIFASLGIMHASLVVHDMRRTPKYFSPLQKSLLPSLQATQAAIAPKSANYWRSILSFHLSHALGVLIFAALIFAASRSDFLLLKTFVFGVCAAYATLSVRYWFINPTVGILLGTAFVAAGWFL
jgi:hypothetical protein